jgi:hypothetical protein
MGLVFIGEDSNVSRVRSYLGTHLDQRVIWILYRMANCSWIRIDFVVISAWVCFVAEEMNRSIFDSARLLSILFQVL